MAAPVFRSELADAIRQGLLAGATVVVILFPTLLNSTLEGDLNSRNLRATESVSTAKSTPRYADFGYFSPATDAFYVANWIADSVDNAGSDFILVDKKHANVLVFDARARLRAASPVLLGGAKTWSGSITMPPCRCTAFLTPNRCKHLPVLRPLHATPCVGCWRRRTIRASSLRLSTKKCPNFCF